MTPSRKKLGKAVAHGSKKAVAKHCLDDTATAKYLFELIGIRLRNELRKMSSFDVKSCLRSQTMESLQNFSWSCLIEEMDEHSPILLYILQACTKTTTERKNVSCIIGACAAILLKHRNNKMSLFHKVISIILYSGHCSKQVILYMVMNGLTEKLHILINIF